MIKQFINIKDPIIHNTDYRYIILISNNPFCSPDFDFVISLQRYFPEFNKDKLAPHCTKYDGYWWDIDDIDSRIQALNKLISIYEKKLDSLDFYNND